MELTRGAEAFRLADAVLAVEKDEETREGLLADVFDGLFGLQA